MGRQSSSLYRSQEEKKEWYGVGKENLSPLDRQRHAPGTYFFQPGPISQPPVGITDSTEEPVGDFPTQTLSLVRVI